MVYSNALEKRRTGNRSGGSNPSPSSDLPNERVLVPGSSMVEHPAVNGVVVGSSPTLGGGPFCNLPFDLPLENQKRSEISSKVNYIK